MWFMDIEKWGCKYFFFYRCIYEYIYLCMYMYVCMYRIGVTYLKCKAYSLKIPKLSEKRKYILLKMQMIILYDYDNSYYYW